MLSGASAFDRECSSFFLVKISAPLSSKSEKMMYLCKVTCCFTFDLLKSVRTTRYRLTLKQQTAKRRYKIFRHHSGRFCSPTCSFRHLLPISWPFHSGLSRILFSTITVDNFVDKVWAQSVSNVSVTDFFIRPFFVFKKTDLFSVAYK